MKMRHFHLLHVILAIVLLTLTLSLFKNNSYCFSFNLIFGYKLIILYYVFFVDGEIKLTYLLTFNVTNFFQSFSLTIATSFLELFNDKNKKHLPIKKN